MSPDLTDRVLARLGLPRRPTPTLADLGALYAAWCQRVPFDNLRKLIHLREGRSGPFPGSSAEDFFEAWLSYGTGGTCWSGAGALHRLLITLGFSSDRGIATMLVAPQIPPNHGTVVVAFESARYLVDTSILHGEPLLLDDAVETAVEHPAWGVRCQRREERWHVAWRPLHQVKGFECRLERGGASAKEYQTWYENTRDWSPFNYQVTARLNRDTGVEGIAFGMAVRLGAEGTVVQTSVTETERRRILIEQIGISEKLVNQLPEDLPTPPPPGSATARIRQDSILNPPMTPTR